MTRDEFNNTGFGPNMYALYKIDERQPDPEVYPISAVNFCEGLIELKCDDGDFIWVRCESVDLTAWPSRR